jgi:hypothetical protein
LLIAYVSVLAILESYPILVLMIFIAGRVVQNAGSAFTSDWVGGGEDEPL